MSKYEVKSVVCDYGVFEDNELKLICNSHANALKIKEILETDSDMSKPYVWQDKTILDLEAKLAESEEKCKKAYQEGLLQKQFDKDMEIEQLKQQLAEKDKELYLTKDTLQHHTNIYNNLMSDLKTIKIDYAVEKLERVKEFFLEEHRDEEMDTDYIITKDAGEIADYILDQIKQLKEGK